MNAPYIPSTADLQALKKAVGKPKTPPNKKRPVPRTAIERLILKWQEESKLIYDEVKRQASGDSYNYLSGRLLEIDSHICELRALLPK